jgi:hypothetical protein
MGVEALLGTLASTSLGSRSLGWMGVLSVVPRFG